MSLPYRCYGTMDARGRWRSWRFAPTADEDHLLVEAATAGKVIDPDQNSGQGHGAARIGIATQRRRKPEEADGTLPQDSAEAPTETRQELARITSVAHNMTAKVVHIATHADRQAKAKLSTGDALAERESKGIALALAEEGLLGLGAILLGNRGINPLKARARQGMKPGHGGNIPQNSAGSATLGQCRKHVAALTEEERPGPESARAEKNQDEGRRRGGPTGGRGEGKAEADSLVPDLAQTYDPDNTRNQPATPTAVRRVVQQALLSEMGGEGQ